MALQGRAEGSVSEVLAYRNITEETALRGYGDTRWWALPQTLLGVGSLHPSEQALLPHTGMCLYIYCGAGGGIQSGELAKEALSAPDIPAAHVYLYIQSPFRHTVLFVALSYGTERISIKGCAFMNYLYQQNQKTEWNF